MKCSQELAQKEGIFVGITSGATFAAAVEVAKSAHKGANVLAILPDTGERYLSTPLFANVPAEMTPEELEIVKSTPYAHPVAAA
jgi:cysteine synthase A